MNDISIDEARAKIWMYDVDTELELVRSLLKTVTTNLCTAVGEDDSIMQGIANLADNLDNWWTKMCDGFQKATGILGDAIERIAKAGQDVMMKIDETKSKIGS